MAMPNIQHHTTEERPDIWPASLDDLRRQPGRLVFAADLARLRIIRSYDGLKKLPPALSVPSEKRAWEARTILIAIGAGLGLTDDAKATCGGEREEPPVAA
jgi:hypothetical protein